MYFFDAHCDTLSKLADGKESLLTARSVQKTNLRKQIYAVFEGADASKEKVLHQLACIEKLPPMTSYLAFEGLSWVGKMQDADFLMSYEPVYCGLTWNRGNAIGGSCMADRPLSPFGKRIVKRITDGNARIDLSHGGEALFASVLDETDRVLVSHANVYDICRHPRNLKKWQIRELIRCKGFLGLTFYCRFVGGNQAEDFLRHAEYVLEQGGEDILGFGSDMDGCSPIITDREGPEVFARVLDEMEKKQWSEQLIAKICHGNLEACLSSKNGKKTVDKKGKQ